MKLAAGVGEGEVTMFRRSRLAPITAPPTNATVSRAAAARSTKLRAFIRRRAKRPSTFAIADTWRRSSTGADSASPSRKNARRRCSALRRSSGCPLLFACLESLVQTLQGVVESGLNGSSGYVEPMCDLLD